MAELNRSVFRSGVSAASGYLDPTLLRFWFDVDLVGHDALAEAHRAGVPDAELFDAPLLAHEMSHLWQVAATSAGIRWFWHTFLRMRSSADLIRAAATANEGRVAPGIMFHAHENEMSSEFQETFAAAWSVTSVEPWVLGGAMVSAADLRTEGGVRDGAAVFSVDGDIVGASPWRKYVYFADLGQLHAGDHRAVVLGAIHLYEGLASIVEALQMLGRLDRTRPAEQVMHDINTIDQLTFAPLEPYRIARLSYAFMLEREDRDPQALLKLLAIIDTALMMDDWLSILVRDDEYVWSDLAFPFENFLRLLQAIKSSPNELPQLSSASMHEYQDALLELADAPIRSISELSLAAETGALRLISELERSRQGFSPAYFERIKKTIQSAFEIRNRRFGGACPFSLLAYANDVSRLVDAGEYYVGAAQMSEDLAEEYGVDIRLQLLDHMRPLLDEFVLGAQRCSFRDGRCVLRPRAACEGLSDAFQPNGQRCARELMTHHLMQDLGVASIDTGASVS
jgi:hypothetical protein